MIDYMFTGALAVSYYGTPRTTMDIDIVVMVKDIDIKILVQAMQKAKLNTGLEALVDTAKTGYQIITLQDTLTPYSVDLILSNEPLEKKECTIIGQPTYIQTPEALILAKLRMIKATISPERRAIDREDIRVILRFTSVNHEKIENIAKKENTLNILQTIKL
jgi:hypothetical protein